MQLLLELVTVLTVVHRQAMHEDFAGDSPFRDAFPQANFHAIQAGDLISSFKQQFHYPFPHVQR